MSEPTTLCPLQVEILLHYHVSPEPFSGGGTAHTDYLQGFIDDGVIDDSQTPFRLTDKGRAWVYAILGTRCPKPVWVDDSYNVVYDPEIS